MDDMCRVPAGTFRMGSDRFYPEEGPAHPVAVAAFWIDRHPVTNAAFAQFVAATGYITLAERPIDPAEFPGVAVDLLRPGGLVFRSPTGAVDLRDAGSWWRYAPGADWRHPDGPESTI